MDVAGEKEAARPAWGVPKLDLDKVLESKSVGRERKPKPAPVMPEGPPLEPAKRGQESIQAVPPALVAESDKSSEPPNQTLMRYVMKAKYERHAKPLIPPPVAPAMQELLALKASQIDPTAPPATTIEGLIFNKYDTRPPSAKVVRPQY